MLKPEQLQYVIPVIDLALLFLTISIFGRGYQYGPHALMMFLQSIESKHAFNVNTYKIPEYPGHIFFSFMLFVQIVSGQ